MTQFSLKPPPQYDGTNRQPYDTKEGVKGYLGSIKKFRELCFLRQQAVQERKEVLNTLYVFGGRFVLDQFGQVLNSYNPSNTVPEVLTKDEYQAYLDGEAWYKDAKERVGGISYNYGTVLPNDCVVCPHCKTGWTIDTMHDLIHRDMQIDLVPLRGFIGKTVRDVFITFSIFTDAMYINKFEHFLQNDKFIDMSPVYPDKPENKCKKEPIGFFKPEGDLYDYVIQEGDYAFFEKREVFHKNCMREYSTLQSWKNIRDSLYNAGFSGYKVEQIPSEYSGHPFYSKWFLIKTGTVTLKIGERKRVIHLEIITETQINFEDLFTKEKVTKDKNYIHAWGFEDLTRYIKTLKQALLKEKEVIA